MRFAQTPAVDVTDVPADAFILDVREADEWEAGHIEGALHMPMGKVMARFEEIPDDRTVYVICRVGGRSALVTHYLAGQYLHAVNVNGGMLAWASAGRPMVTDDGGTASVL